MRNDIEEILSYAVKRGFYVTVTTNGTLITERRAKRLARIPTDRLHFNFSLDGDRVANDEIRSEGMFDRAITGYQRIRAADSAAGNSRRKILANTILHARNADRFHDILDEQAALGFDGVQILNLFRQGDEVPDETSALWFHPESIDGLTALSESLARRAEGQGVIGYRIQNSPENLRQIPQYYRDELKPLEAPCWAGWKELYINADGEAIMCDGTLDFLNGRFGNVRDQTLRQLWASPALKARRTVVKSCTTPCVQDCYLRQESDSATHLLTDAVRLVGHRLRSRISRWSPKVRHFPTTMLRMELSDVCPCDLPYCTTPAHRWQSLSEGLPAAVDARAWARFRDQGRIDFGRGFMGFEVVRAIIDDLRAHRIRFGTLSVRWRGEPLLHPEAEPILRHILNVIAEGDVADRLCIETDARFLDARISQLAAHPAPQVWRLDATRGGAALVARARQALDAQRHEGVVIQTVFTVDDHVRIEDITQIGLPVHVGRSPIDEDSVWLRRPRYDQFQADRSSHAMFKDVATLLGLRTEEMERPILIPDSVRRPSPTISWDGKVTFRTGDHALEHVVGDVVHGRFSSAWNALGPETASADGAPLHAEAYDQGLAKWRAG